MKTRLDELVQALNNGQTTNLPLPKSREESYVYQAIKQLDGAVLAEPKTRLEFDLRELALNPPGPGPGPGPDPDPDASKVLFIQEMEIHHTGRESFSNSHWRRWY